MDSEQEKNSFPPILTAIDRFKTELWLAGHCSAEVTTPAEQLVKDELRRFAARCLVEFNEHLAGVQGEVLGLPLRKNLTQ